ncbi:hypothetical protein [Ferroacidibacillus organovorans]|nr:hypothetical protein [Ferroacidibacillus organovorans]
MGTTLTLNIFRYINMLCVYEGLESFGDDVLNQSFSFFGAIGLTAAGAFMVGMKNWIVGGFVAMIGTLALITALHRRGSTRLACCGVNMDQEELDCEHTQETGHGDSK